MIAVDTPILFDILIGDARHGEASETCVAEALARDEVVVCAAVVAEVQAMLDTSEDLMDILASVGIRFEPMTEYRLRWMASSICRRRSMKSQRLPPSWRHSTAERNAASNTARISATTPACPR